MVDVIIIGAGIVGCSLAYELSKYQVQTVVLEKENDVACGTTKANSAIVHAGYDPRPGTLMAKYNVEGNRLIEEIAKKLDVPYKKVGSFVLAFDDTDLATVGTLFDRGRQNGVPDLQILSAKETLAIAVSYTHLDVYKRQVLSVSSHIAVAPSPMRPRADSSW